MPKLHVRSCPMEVSRLPTLSPACAPSRDASVPDGIASGQAEYILRRLIFAINAVAPPALWLSARDWLSAFSQTERKQRRARHTGRKDLRVEPTMVRPLDKRCSIALHLIPRFARRNRHRGFVGLRRGFGSTPMRGSRERTSDVT
ncbi:hypothetical protein BYI23_B001060 [Burkholderia sp. YI23]|nr:hypothetical protein BYI23_B001060 [Burkholderia sp. YI23]